jgi:hypothetical protein
MPYLKSATAPMRGNLHRVPLNFEISYSGAFDGKEMTSIIA